MMGGQQPQGYGQPQQQMGYGQPQGGFGAPQGGAALGAPGQFGAAPMGMGGFGGGGGGGGGPVGQTRNPVMVLVLSMITCGLYGMYAVWTMLNELKDYTRDESFKPWQIFIPLLGAYFWLFKVPEQVGKAKQMAGSRNQQSAGFIFYWCSASTPSRRTCNEVWRSPQS
jgi:hypothetical protein